MKLQDKPSIANIIGVLLVIVAIVSAGGLYYVASEYSKISQTLAQMSSPGEASISNVTLVYNNLTEDAILSFSVIVNNTSDLDIVMYNSAFHIYIGKTAMDAYRRETFLGVMGASSKVLIPSDSMMMEIPIYRTVDKAYMPRFHESINADNSVFIFISGSFHYEIEKYPEVGDSVSVLGIFYEVI